MNQTTQSNRIDLTVGPLQYWWPRAQMLAFYSELAEGPADCLVLGEVCCSRRNEFSLAGGGRYSVQPAWQQELGRWAEGQQSTLGAFDRPWR